MPFDQTWPANGSTLVFLVLNSLMRPPGSDNDVPSPTHSFDAGSASGYFALQAHRMGWHTDSIIGFDRDRAFADLGVPVGYRVEPAFAVGCLGDPAGRLQPLRDRERPSPRRPLAELACEGSFSGAD